MLRIIESFGFMPSCYKVDDSKFNPGQIGSLCIKKNEEVISISDGVNPIGIVDDIRDNKIRKVVFDKYINIIHPLLNSFKNKDYVEIGLKENIIQSSFKCNVPNILNYKKGILTVLKKDIENLAHIIVSYAYNENFDHIDDSISSTNRVTIWDKILIAETDMFDTSVNYKNQDNLYVSNGYLTSKQYCPNSKCIGKVLYQPTSGEPVLKFLFDPKGKFPNEY